MASMPTFTIVNLNYKKVGIPFSFFISFHLNKIQIISYFVERGVSLKKNIFFIIWGLCLFCVCFHVSAESVTDLAPNSKSAILMDAQSGKILYSKNETEALPPASMTKLMSMLLIMEAIDNGTLTMDTDVTISENAAGMGGSQVFLEAGEVYKVQELLKGIAIASGNDAVVAMAEKIAGTVDDFVVKMNERAKELGLKSTTFKNPHGLDTEGHVSSAYDMALIAKELLKHPKILEFTSIYEDYLQKNDGSSTWLVNTNKLVRFYDGVDGLKTGFTSSAGYCLTATAKKNNLRLIAVVMGAPTSDNRSSDISSMLNYGFNTYKSVVVLTKDVVLGTKRVENGKKDTVDIVLKEDYTKLLENTEPMPNYSYNLKVDKFIAPVEAGTTVGTVEVVDQNGKVIDNLEVTVKETVEKSSFWELWLQNIKRITSGKILVK